MRGTRLAQLAAAILSATPAAPGPRAVLSRMAADVIRASSAAPIRCRVCAVSGQWSETTSAVASSSPSGMPPERLVCTTRMPSASAREATARPMRPLPTMPSTAPSSSAPHMSCGPQPAKWPARR